MSPARRITSVLLALIGCLAVASTGSAECVSEICTGAFTHVQFIGDTPGLSVEGLGTVDNSLSITSVHWPLGPSCSAGSAFWIRDGDPTVAAYGTLGPTANGCLNGQWGFGDSTGCVLDYDFSFAPGLTVECFSIRMLDFGDLYPFGVAGHQVTVTAFDATNNVVDQDVLSTFGPVDPVGGDACDAGPNTSGNHIFFVAGPDIVRVTLRFDASPDPNVGFDDISFCAHGGSTTAVPASWGELKTIYR